MRFNLVLALTILMAACTEKGKPIHEHTPAQPTSERESQIVPNPGADPSPEADLNNVLVPLSEKVLNPTRIRDPKSINSRQVRDDLIVFNRILIEQIGKAKDRSQIQQIANRYKAGVWTDCSEFKDSCTGYRYFKLASTSSTVIKLFLQNGLAEEKEQPKLTLMALELKNRAWDQELTELLFARALDLQSDHFSNLASTAIIEAAQHLQTADLARPFLKKIQIWKLVSERKVKLTDAGVKALFQMAGLAGVFADAQGRLTPDLKAWAQTLEANPASVRRRQNELSRKNVLNLTSIGAKPIGAYDPLHFALDAVFTETLTPTSGSALAKSLGLKPTTIASSIENYLRVQFATYLAESTEMMVKVLNSDVATEDLLWHAMTGAETIRRVWGDFSSRAEALRSLMLLIVGQDDAQTRSQIQRLFDSIPRSIKMAATYPHEMALFYKLSQKQFRIRLPFSGMELDTSWLLQYLFEGRLPVLFPYSDDRKELTYYEIIHAFDMGVRSGVFRLMKIDIDDLVADTLKKIAEPNRIRIDQVMERMDQRLRQTHFARDFQRICSEFETGAPKSPRTLYFTQVRVSPIYGDLASFAVTSVSSMNTYSWNGGITREAPGLFFADSTYNEMLEATRLGLGTIQRLGESLIGVLRLNSVNAKTKLTDKELTAIRDTRAKVLQKTSQYQKELGNCYYRLNNRDRDTAEKVIEYEKEHLKNLHRALSKIRAGNLSPEKVNVLQAQFALQGLPNGFTGLDRLSANGVSFHSLDFQIRISKYISEGAVFDGRKWPAIAPEVSYDYGTSMTTEDKVVKSSHQVYLRYLESENDFVEQGLRALFVGADFVFWESQRTGPIIVARDLFKNAILAHRLDGDLHHQPKFISARHILNSYREFLDYMRLGSTTIELMNTLRLRTRDSTMPYLMFDRLFARVDMNQINKFGDLTDLWGLYDFILQMMSTEEMGFKLEGTELGLPGGIFAQRETAFQGGEKYFNSRSAIYRGIPLLSYSRELDDFMDRNMKRFVGTELRLMREFYAETQKVTDEFKALPEDKRPYVDLSLDVRITEPYSHSIMGDFSLKQRKFHRATDGFYQSQ